MGKELVPVGPIVEGELYELNLGARFDEYIFDEYIDVLPANEVEVSTPLDDEDEAALADGIASVFDALRAEAEDEDPTFVLLAELNRLWAEPLAA